MTCLISQNLRIIRPQPLRYGLTSSGYREFETFLLRNAIKLGHPDSFTILAVQRCVIITERVLECHDELQRAIS